jgi:hypothetical protein
MTECAAIIGAQPFLRQFLSVAAHRLQITRTRLIDSHLHPNAA